MTPILRMLALGITLAILPAKAEERTYSFGVITQRSPVLTAQYWNPILRHVSEKSGVALTLKLAKTAPDHSDMIGRGEFDFIYSNHNFTPKNDAVGYRVVARPLEAAIMGQIVVPGDSPIQSLAELDEREVVFPSKVAFVGYHVPMDALLRAGVRVKPLFAGNQEGAMGQLKTGRVPAAGVNSQIMRDYAEREGYRYRVLWASEPYLNIPVSAHPSVPATKVKAVQQALVAMSADAEGAKILAASAELIKQKPPYGFIAATDRDFDNYRQFYRKTLVKE
ncbi:MAG: phosphate/phosphite/phosphonate ABC transporter substrate-binding protein [Betaproteobacteria bacterium]|nr:phosphate/phosphite/phosphonate ABC transporter substrate-binding protein [Betaproteobacteria bacterium]